MKSIPHPLVHLRNFLNSRYPLSETKLKSIAASAGYNILGPSNHGAQNDPKNVAPTVGNPYRFQRIATDQLGHIFFHRLQEILSKMKVPFFLGGTTDANMLAINVSCSDQQIIFSILQNWFEKNEEVGIETAEGFAEDVNLFFTKDLGAITYLKLAIKEKHYKQTTIYCSVILLNFWDRKQLYGNNAVFESGMVNPFVKRVKASTYAEFQRTKHDLGAESDLIGSHVRFPIDVVYTWVNDQDDSWRVERDTYAIAAGKGGQNRGAHAERWKNRDELKFSLRSLDLFAPFVNNVYIVTNGQVPSWLNVANPRVRVVTHSEIYRDTSALPTFNSSGIETQLHHIDGLSEYFLYFNDDFFLGNLCNAEDFFYPNGVIKYFPTDQRVYESEITDESEEYIIADANALKLFKSRYGRYNREIMMHAPYACSKTLLSEMEAWFKLEYADCAKQRFRSAKDLRPIAFMQYHAGFQEKLALPSKISHRYLALWKPDIDKQMQNVLKSKKAKTFCINDVGVEDDRAAWVDNAVSAFLQDYYPLKSSFEI